MILEMKNVFSEFSAKQWLLWTKDGHCTIYAFICQKHKGKWLNWRFCRELSISIICPCLYSQWATTGNRGRSCTYLKPFIELNLLRRAAPVLLQGAGSLFTSFAVYPPISPVRSKKWSILSYVVCTMSSSRQITFHNPSCFQSMSK